MEIEQLDLPDEVRDLFKRKLSEFVTFCAHDWQMSADEHAEIFPDQGEDHRAGYNAAMREGVAHAVDCWAEPFDYT